jgi:hypothetical protein
MNYNKELNLTHSKSKAQRWCIGLIWGLIVTFGILNFGCEDCDCGTDEYYVKYDVNSSTIYSNGKLNVTYKTENNTNNTLTINQRQLWETNVGPVKKGFTATMQIDAVGTTNNQLKLYTNIYVSKNNGPFVLKKTDGSDTPRDFVEISYTIDY